MECLRTIIMECLPTIIKEVIFGTGGGVIDSNITGFPKLNESVYEFYRPESEISPDVEVVLFHGVCQKGSNQAYLETWTCSDGSTSHCWPTTWVAEKFPRTRILSVSYDSSMRKGPKQGRMELYCVAENLIQDLTDRNGNVGVRDSCPLILVGHGFGGLVIKAVCLEASYRGMDTFLCNVKAILYYSTPHLGLSNMPAEFDGKLAKTMGWGNNDIARLNDRFQKLRKAKKWETKAILAGYPGKERRLDPKEASVRYDVDDLYTAQEDIDTICRPREDTSITVTSLTGLISKYIAYSSGPGGATKPGVKLTSSLLFENDEYYVPMKRSRDEIRNALNSPNVRIVVLHGLPGSGKSSLAKHLALWFADESNMHCQDQGTTGTSSDSGQRSRFTDGVVYLTCGVGADVISKQQELLQNFSLTLADNEVHLGEDGLKRRLAEHLRDLKALVILDDIWDPILFEKLLVPGQIKYLVTTQDTMFRIGSNVENVRIQNVCREDARKILGNYAGFRGGMIPEELTEIADELIDATESHPLALTTLATIINHKGKTSEEEWRDVRQNFLHCLKSQSFKLAIGFAETYPKTVYAAMTSVVELLDDSEKNFLYTIVQFQGPVIPECLVRLFLERTEPGRSWETTYPARRGVLERLGLVQSVFLLLQFGASSPHEHRAFDALSPHRHRAFLIHGLRKQFILSRMLDNPDDSKTKFAVKDGSLLYEHEGFECERDLATVVCSVFGGTIIKKAAITKLGARFIWSDFSLFVHLIPWFLWLLFLMVEEIQYTKAATEVFWMLFNKGELDDDNMSSLLCGKTTKIACSLLTSLSSIFHDTPHAVRVVAIPYSTNKVIDLLDHKEKMVQTSAIETITYLAVKVENRVLIVKNFPSCLKKLVALLATDVDEGNQKGALKALAYLAELPGKYVASTNIASTSEIPVKTEVLQTPDLLESVVMHLSKDSKGTCEEAAELITNITFDVALIPTIAQFPSCLERLVALLALDVDKGAQKAALMALANLARTHDIPSLMKIFQTPGLLESVVMHLSKDIEVKCEVATQLISNLSRAGLEPTWSIVQFPSCLKGLVALLAPDVHEDAQNAALITLSDLASTQDIPTLKEIFKTPGLLESLVMHLSGDTNSKCEKAAILICNLARGGEEHTIVQFPLCLQKLVALLAPDVDEGAQKAALSALTNLASTNNVLLQMEILGASGLLKSVVMHLSKDTEGKCEKAANLICNLAQGGEELTIVRFPLCLQKLVDLLAPDVDEGAQKAALSALVYLTNTDHILILEEMTLLKTPELLQSVIMHLSKDMGGKCEKAAHLICNLARGGEELTIVDFPLCLQKLVALLTPDVHEGAQNAALGALGNLANTHDIPLLMDGLLESVVMHLSKDTMGKCEMAASVICNLSRKRGEVNIVRFPSCLQNLVALLALGVNEGAQRAALKALGNLANSHDIPLLTEIGGTPGLLEGVVMHLSKDAKGMYEAALRVISSLSLAALKPTIVRVPFCLKRLVALLDLDVDEKAQKAALMTLTRLADTLEIPVVMEILETPGLLQNVVMHLSKDMKGRYEEAANLICNLTKAGEEPTIIRFPLCLQNLVALLTPDVHDGAQRAALKALVSLANTRDFPLRMEILGTSGLLESVVRHLSKDMEDKCEGAAILICVLAIGEGIHTIVRFPLCLQKLVTLLACDVNEGAQRAALTALGNLTATDDISLLMEICRAPGLLEGVVMHLSKDTKGMYQAALMVISNLSRVASKPMIVRFPFCLKRLVALLDLDVDEEAQKAALMTLTRLANTPEIPIVMEILGTPGLLQILVMHLSKDTKCRCKEAANLICNLAKAREKLTIVRFPLCLQKLVALLAPDVDEGAQKAALSTLTNLASPINTPEIPVVMEILETPGLLQNVVMHLSKDMEGKYEIAASLICNLARQGGQLTIARFPSCLQKLGALLAPDVNGGVQRAALLALINLAGTSENLVLMEILGTPGLLERVVMLSSKDDKLISRFAILALVNLGMNDENKVDQKMLVTGNLVGSSVLLPPDNSQAEAMWSSSDYSVRDVIEGLLTKTLVARNSCSELYMLWSDFDLRRKNYPAALTCITKALVVNPDNGLLLQKRGLLQWHKGDFPGALADFNKALEMDANNGFRWQERGVLRRFMKDFPGALEDLNKALQLDPDDYEVLKHRGLVKFMMEDEEGAREVHDGG